MKKQILALFSALTLLLAALPTAYAYAGETQRTADTLSTLGLVQPAEDYRLSAPATRAHAVTMLVRLAGAEKTAASTNWISGFTDLPAWVVPAVTYASRQGWVSGITATRFAPEQTVTANAYCTFLLRMLGYRDNDGDFSVSSAALFAQRIGLTARAYSGTLTRGDLFQITLDALTFPYKGTEETVLSRLTSSGAVSSSAANALGLLSPELTARQVADRYLSAVFQLECYETEEEIQKGTSSADASGFFISSDGLAVTNYHSISGAIYATATLSTGEVFPVERVLFYDTAADAAVLQISRTPLNGTPVSAFSFLPMVSAQTVRAGDPVYTLGNPLGLGLAISSGIVSDPTRHVERYSNPCIMDTADISQGSSGGALLNVYGQVIGITSGAFSYGNNMYLAVPIDVILKADLTADSATLAEVAAREAAAAKK